MAANGKDEYYIGHGNFVPAIAGPNGVDGLRAVQPGIAGVSGAAVAADWSDPVNPNAARECKSTTAAGTPCRMAPLLGEDLCTSHKAKAEREAAKA